MQSFHVCLPGAHAIGMWHVSGLIDILWRRFMGVLCWYMYNRSITLLHLKICARLWFWVVRLRGIRCRITDEHAQNCLYHRQMFKKRATSHEMSIYSNFALVRCHVCIVSKCYTCVPHNFRNKWNTIPLWPKLNAGFDCRHGVYVHISSVDFVYFFPKSLHTQKNWNGWLKTECM